MNKIKVPPHRRLLATIMEMPLPTHVSLSAFHQYCVFGYYIRPQELLELELFIEADGYAIYNISGMNDFFITYDKFQTLYYVYNEDYSIYEDFDYISYDEIAPLNTQAFGNEILRLNIDGVYRPCQPRL